MSASGERDLDTDGESLSEREFQRLSTFIHARSGINLTKSKKFLLEGRLRRRLRELGLGSFSAYCRYLFDSGHADDEELAVIDLITTNKTEFFRELHHFKFLAETVLPDLLKSGRDSGRPLRLWSAGCSNGAEPYSIAMVCQAFADRQAQVRFGVLGTDISVSMVRAAQRAVYPHGMIEAVPMEWRKRYLLRAIDAAADEVRIAPEVRRLVSFGLVNLAAQSYPIEQKIDVIFCRNVLIYFDKPTQRAVLARLCHHLVDGGYLILGHSESVAGLSLPLRAVAPTVFLRDPAP